MNKPLKRLLAGLALATAAATGTLTTSNLTAPPDTAWGAPATTPDIAPADEVIGTIVTPLDTAWG